MFTPDDSRTYIQRLTKIVSIFWDTFFNNYFFPVSNFGRKKFIPKYRVNTVYQFLLNNNVTSSKSINEEMKVDFHLRKNAADHYCIVQH